MRSGRACYGMVTITARTIAWATPFSRRRAWPDRVTDSEDDPDRLRVTFRLLKPSRHPVLALIGANPVADIGWNVVGYPSLDGATRPRQEGELGCYLYRAGAGKGRAARRFAGPKR